MAWFPCRIKRTDVYTDVEYGRGADLALASKQPVKDAVGARIGWVGIEDNGEAYVEKPDGLKFAVIMREYAAGARGYTVERYRTLEEAYAAHDRCVLELRVLCYDRGSSVTK